MLVSDEICVRVIGSEFESVDQSNGHIDHPINWAVIKQLIAY